MPETEEAQPTPGPWYPHSDHRGHCYVTDGDDGRIDETEIAGLIEGRGGPHGDEPKANARLIAAAGTAASELPPEYDPVGALAALPNLLSTIERMLDEIESDEPSEPGAQHPSSGAILSMKGALQKARGGSHE